MSARLDLLAEVTFKQLLGVILTVIGLSLFMLGISMHRRRVDRNAPIPASLQGARGQEPS